MTRYEAAFPDCAALPLSRAAAGPAVPAYAERLIASLSNHRVMVTSDFTGEELVLFGGIEPDAGSRPRRAGYDIVVTVTGPRQTVVNFRKARMLGIWVNGDLRVFENAPSYLAVLSNRPLEAIANPETLRRLQLGLDNTPLPQRASINIADAASDDPFRIAFIRLKIEQQALPRSVERRDLPHTDRCSGPRSHCRPWCRWASTRST